MRLKLKKGKQEQLIEIAKKEKTWKDLSKLLGLKADYIRIDLKNEHRLLSEDSYNIQSQIYQS